MRSVIATVLFLSVVHGQTTPYDVTQSLETLNNAAERYGASAAWGYAFGFDVAVSGDWAAGGAGGWLGDNPPYFTILYKKNATGHYNREQIIDSQTVTVGGGKAISLGSTSLIVGGFTSTNFYDFNSGTGLWEQTNTDVMEARCSEQTQKPCETVELTDDGLYAIVGAPEANGLDGKIRIYTRQGGDWSGTLVYDEFIGPTDVKIGEVVDIADGGEYACSCGIGPRGTNAPNGNDFCYIFKRTGATWAILDTLTKANDAPGLYGTTYYDFGATCEMSDDGSLIFISQTNNGQVWSAIHLYKKDLVNVDEWDFVETLPKPTLASNAYGFSTEYNQGRFIVGDNAAYTNDGMVSLYYESGGTWVIQDDFFKPVPSVASNDRCGIAVDIVGDTIVTGCQWYKDYTLASETLSTQIGRVAMWNDVPSFPTAAPTPQPTPAPTLPQCTVSADCTNNFYCKGTSCIDPAPCTVHNDCAGAFNAGRLPYCAPNGFCKDVAASTCTTPTLCGVAATKYDTQRKSVGSIKQDVSTITNSVTRLTAAKSLITNLKTSETVDSDLVVSIKGEETVTMGTSLYEGLNASAVEAELEKLKIVRCAEAVDYCTVSITGNSRRMLGAGRELSQTVVVTIVYDVPDDIFDQIENSTSFDDPDFLADLAVASGVDQSEINVYATEGTLVIEFTLTDESGDDTPTDETVFGDITALQGSLTTVTDTVVGELNLTASDILTEELDLCGDRTCNGFGAELCNVETGVCDCPLGYLGINCDVSLNCGSNGDIVVGTTYCACDYPYYGFKCHLNRTCDETCS